MVPTVYSGLANVPPHDPAKQMFFEVCCTFAELDQRSTTL